MITKKELQILHNNLEFEVKLKLREQGNYEGYEQDLIALSNYKDQLQD